MPWKPSRSAFVHILAALIVVGCFVMMAKGVDGVIHTTLIAVVIYYFGQQGSGPRQQRRLPTE